MGKFMKPGKVVMVLAGRYAGRKAVIVKVRQSPGWREGVCSFNVPGLPQYLQESSY